MEGVAFILVLSKQITIFSQRIAHSSFLPALSDVAAYRAVGTGSEPELTARAREVDTPEVDNGRGHKRRATRGRAVSVLRGEGEEDKGKGEVGLTCGPLLSVPCKC
jgi:hypothetical protein